MWCPEVRVGQSWCNGALVTDTMICLATTEFKGLSFQSRVWGIGRISQICTVRWVLVCPQVSIWLSLAICHVASSEFIVNPGGPAMLARNLDATRESLATAKWRILLNTLSCFVLDNANGCSLTYRISSGVMQVSSKGKVKTSENCIYVSFWRNVYVHVAAGLEILHLKGLFTTGLLDIVPSSTASTNYQVRSYAWGPWLHCVHQLPFMHLRKPKLSWLGFMTKKLFWQRPRLKSFPRPEPLFA